jgi:hypothetical protein
MYPIGLAGWLLLTRPPVPGTEPARGVLPVPAQAGERELAATTASAHPAA